jgi:uncharacterized protein (TIGR02996 family)
VTDTDHKSFELAILADPADDTVRLVYADWLEENGEPERAAFIRVQIALARAPDTSHCTELSASWCPVCEDCICPSPEDAKDSDSCPLHARLSPHAGDLYTQQHALWAERLPDGYTRGYHWFTRELGFSAELDGAGMPPTGNPRAVVRRGFVAEWHGELREFYGGSCGRCRVPHVGVSSGVVVHDVGGGHLVTGVCGVCAGTGRTEGAAAGLFRAHPLTDVRLVDREPRRYPMRSMADQVGTWAFVAISDDGDFAASPEAIPMGIREKMSDWPAIGYAAPAAAHAALSRACVAYGRGLAGLPAFA